MKVMHYRNAASSRLALKENSSNAKSHDLVFIICSSLLKGHSSHSLAFRHVFEQKCKRDVTIASRMPLLELQQLSLNKTVIGTRCPDCGGVLEAKPLQEHSLLSRFFKKFTAKACSYSCADCNTRFSLIENAKLLS